MIDIKLKTKAAMRTIFFKQCCQLYKTKSCLKYINKNLNQLHIVLGSGSANPNFHKL